MDSYRIIVVSAEGEEIADILVQGRGYMNVFEDSVDNGFLEIPRDNIVYRVAVIKLSTGVRIMFDVGCI